MGGCLRGWSFDVRDGGHEVDRMIMGAIGRGGVRIGISHCRAKVNREVDWRSMMHGDRSGGMSGQGAG